MDLQLQQVCDGYIVTTQIAVEHLPEIKALGYKSVLCTRPNGEDPGQTDYEEICKAASDLGLECRQIEVFGHIGITPENLSEFVDAWEELPRPIFGYCRSGTRAATLYRYTENMR